MPAARRAPPATRAHRAHFVERVAGAGERGGRGEAPVSVAGEARCWALWARCRALRRGALPEGKGRGGEKGRRTSLPA
jgi:hypothetical protein